MFLVIFEPEINPYANVIRNFDFSKFLGADDDPQYRELDETPLVWIDTVVELEKMAKALLGETVIAVDLEHHNMFSYHGLTCLMQISTDKVDYLIDTIKLRSSIHANLAPIFSNPSILKIFHGAESDNVWLQRDFNLFIVGMFDTYYAAKALGMERFSFAFLLDYYVGIQADKTHQMSDWRVRPLPEDMQLYARQDTHYLIYIYERMKSELLAKDNGNSKSLLDVFRRSSNQSLSLYKIENESKDAWRAVIQRSTAPFSSYEMERVRRIYQWRDEVARKEDVSLHALLPNPLIIKLAQSEPGSDPVKILSLPDLDLAIKNVESLKAILDEVNPKFKEPAMKPQKAAAVPTHIIFNDQEEEQKLANIAASKKMTIASKPLKTKGKSLFGAFNNVSTNKDALDSTAPVIANLEITKVSKAAALLKADAESELKTKDDESVMVTDEPVEMEKPKEVVAKVISTGQVLTEQDILIADPSTVLDLGIRRPKNSKVMPAVEIFDFSKAAADVAMEEEVTDDDDVCEEIVDGQPVLKEAPSKPKPQRKRREFPQIEEPVFEGGKKAPKLSSKPRSGNRNMTFH